MKTKLLIVYTLLCTLLTANEYELHIGSLHYKAKSNTGYNLNNLNYGIGYNTNWYNVGFGYYKNSIERDSFYVKSQYSLSESINIEYGLVTGYDGVYYNEAKQRDEHLFNTWAVIPLLGVSYEYNNYKITVAPVGDNAIIHFSYLFKDKKRKLKDISFNPYMKVVK